jgi:hypothetical protein
MSLSSLPLANSRARRAARRRTSEGASTASDAGARPVQVCSTQYQSRIRDGGTRDQRRLIETVLVQIACASPDNLTFHEHS